MQISVRNQNRLLPDDKDGLRTVVAWFGEIKVVQVSERNGE